MISVPHSPEAEAALLACCLIDETPTSLAICQEKSLAPESFYSARHQVVYSAILAVKEKGMGVNEITVAEQLQSRGELEQAGGLIGLNQLTEKIFTADRAEDYAAIVREKHQRRQIIHLSRRMAEEASSSEDSPTTIISRANKDFVNLSADKTSTLRPASETFPEVLRQMEEERNNPVAASGIPTGLADLDLRLNGGFKPENLVIIAARPSTGKSSLARQVARNAAIPIRRGREPETVLFFGLEMSTPETNMAMLASESRVPINRYKEGMAKPEEVRRIKEAAERMAKAPIYFEDIAHLTIYEIGGIARRFALRKKPGLIVIDYLQIITPGDRRMNREQQISEISRNAKILAKDLKAPVILLSQLNRDSVRESRAPRLEDLRESGSIEQDADVVLLLHQKTHIGPDGSSVPVEPNKVDVIIGKQRGGARNITIPMTWTPEITRFDNYANDNPNWAVNHATV